MNTINNEHNMKFDCKEISISDEEIGCTLVLSEKEEEANYSEGMTIDQIMSSIGPYLLLQRTYPEEEYEKDYYYIETSDLDNTGELKDFIIDLYRTKFQMIHEDEIHEIGINVNDKEYENLKAILLKLTNNIGELIFHD